MRFSYSVIKFQKNGCKRETIYPISPKTSFPLKIISQALFVSYIIHHVQIMLFHVCLRICILQLLEKYFRNPLCPAVPYLYLYFIFVVVVTFYKIYSISHVSMGNIERFRHIIFYHSLISRVMVKLLKNSKVWAPTIRQDRGKSSLLDVETCGPQYLV